MNARDKPIFCGYGTNKKLELKWAQLLHGCYGVGGGVIEVLHVKKKKIEN